MEIQNQMNTEYQSAVDSIANLLDLDTEIKETVGHHIENLGIITFFLNLEAFDFPTEVLSKLQALKVVIEVFEGGEEIE